MIKQKIYSILATLTFVSSVSLSLVPVSASALEFPKDGNSLAEMYGLDAKAYAVMDVSTGELLINKNADLEMTPASLTKLVTALVVLDTKPKLTKQVAITAADQTMGACGRGGSCIKAKAGVKYTVDGLFHAALLPSANNAAAALARSTGLTNAQFAAKMNAKAKALGATHSHFVEPTGMSSNNVVTAEDFAKIVSAAFSNKYLQTIAQKPTFYLKSSNNSKYNQTIKNSDKLLDSDTIKMLGAKTGYLTSYNFASLLTYNGHKLAVVVLGEPHLYTAFNETKLLADIAATTKQLFALK